MAEINDDLSLSSASEDDNIQHLVIDQMKIKEIVDFIDLNCHEYFTVHWLKNHKQKEKEMLIVLNFTLSQ